MRNLDEIVTIEESALAEKLRPAIAGADRIHLWPELTPIPVVMSRTRTYQGAYNYLQRPNRAISIEISRHAIHPALTLLHELGHMMDHMVLNSIRAEFGSDRDSRFAEIAELWQQTDMVKRLKRAVAVRGHLAAPSARRAILDQLTDRELWARTYAQWIATASGDRVLYSQLADARAAGHFFANVRYSFQWDDGEFVDIIKAVGNLMREAGLL